ncbi:hypothetical protein GGS20DRAFT_589139 [Poronia punctata]|nr:hypothetical protein GGS20DRAFT_589139 [Poronia punctata]
MAYNQPPNNGEWFCLPCNDIHGGGGGPCPLVQQPIGFVPVFVGHSGQRGFPADLGAVPAEIAHHDYRSRAPLALSPGTAYQGVPNSPAAIGTAPQAFMPAPTRPHQGLVANSSVQVSSNYRGDPSNDEPNLLDRDNCSLWVTRLPADTTHKTLLQSIRNCGKVYACVLNPPQRANGLAASKIIFFDVAGAQALLHQFITGEFVVGGMKPLVRYNRFGCRAQPSSTRTHSRVLNITGPSHMVNQATLTNLFTARNIKWQNEEVLVEYTDGEFTHLEWRFGGYRYQAELAYKAISEEIAAWDPSVSLTQRAPAWRNVTVQFGKDPCAP